MALFFVSVILGACTPSKGIEDYVEVSFSGLDTQGIASFSIDYEAILNNIYGYDEEKPFPNKKMEDEMTNLSDRIQVEIEPKKNLSNGDKVKMIITVDEKKTQRIKSSEKKVEVTGLEEPKILTSKEVEKRLVLNFTGVSGQGSAIIDNTFEEPLNYIDFQVENDGNLSNGDKLKVSIKKIDVKQLNNEGYLLEEGFAPTFEVKGLDVVADKASDIKNLADITRMIDEGIKRTYQDFKTDWSLGHRYEIKEVKYLYRQFKNESSKNSDSWNTGLESNGNLVKIYLVKKYSGGTESKLEDSFTAIYGFSDITLDDKNEANVAEIKEISTKKDDTYSLESVLKLYEGYGYTEVEN